MKVVATNIGNREIHQFNNKTAETGIFKYPTNNPIFLDKETVKNDAVIDRKYHGGIDQAVYAYNANHYKYWQQLYPHLKFDFGMFGENLTIENLDETTICVGDVYQIGNCLIEVTKPREPCFKLMFRFLDTAIVSQFWNTTFSGVYFKVLQTGTVSTNDVLHLVEKSINKPTIAAVYENLRPKNNYNSN